MASTQSESNTNSNTEWVAVINDEKQNRTNPKPDLYQNTEFIEDDGIIFRSQAPSDQSADLSPHPIDRRTFNYLTAAAPIRVRAILQRSEELPRVPSAPQARPFEVVVLPHDANDGIEGAFPKTTDTNSSSITKP